MDQDLSKKIEKLYSSNKFKEVIELSKKFPDSNRNENFWEILGYSQLKSGLDCESSFLNLIEIYLEKKLFNKALLEIENLIKINPNLKEEHYTKGRILSNLNNIESGLRSFQLGIAENKMPELCHMGIGLIEKNIKGNDLEAINHFKKSLAIKELPDVYNELGLIFLNGDIKVQNFKEAEIAFDKAINIEQGYISAILNKGLLLNRQKRYEDSLKCYLSPFLKKDNYHLDPKSESYGIISGRIAIALNYIAKQKSRLNNFQMQLLQFIIQHAKDSSIKARSSGTFKICIRDITKKLLQIGFTNHYILENKFDEIVDKKLKDHLNLDTMESSEILNNHNIKEFLNSDIINYTLKEFRIIDYLSEKVITSLRRALLIEISKNSKELNIDKIYKSFLISLCSQSDLNEYCWTQTNEEMKLIDKIYQKILDKIKNKDHIETYEILIINSYKSLQDFKGLTKHLINNFKDGEISEFVKKQILDIEYEHKLAKNIPTINKIDNKVSKLVRNQYESNPYPRWKDSLRFTPTEYIKLVQSNIAPNKLPFEYFEKKVEIKKLLVAGCGTGRHPIELALMDPSLQIDALDISLSSLSYGKRKAKEMGISNIKWLHGDILNLKNNEDQYDAIESSGVIHHMENPTLGFNILEKKLKKDGIFKLGLYSRISKQKLIPAKELVNNLKKEDSSSLDFVREARDRIGNSNNKEIKKAMKYGDFFSSSEFRDLVFHEQEHFISIPEIKKLIENKFHFLGFIIKEHIMHQIIDISKKNNMSLDLSSLDTWNEIENANNDLFDEMYHFFLLKN